MRSLRKRALGRSGVAVTELGLGGAPFGGMYSPVSESDAVATVRRALELGVNFVDTAPLYGFGASEAFFGRALAGTPRSAFVLSTKVGRVLEPVAPGAERRGTAIFKDPYPFDSVFDFSAEGIRRSFYSSLERLKLDSVDVLLIHDPDNHEEQALGETYPVLAKLREEGLVRALGAGMNQWEMLARFARAADFDCFLLAGRYTLIDHTGLAELLPLCVERNISIIVGGPYNSGILATGAIPGAKFNYEDASPELLEHVRRVEGVGKRHGVSLRAAALQFPLAHPAVVSVIPGARSASEVEENLSLIEAPIPAAFWQELLAERLLPENAPVPV